MIKKGKRESVWDDISESGFQSMKEKIAAIENKFLYIPRRWEQLGIRTEASVEATGGVLFVMGSLTPEETTRYSDEELTEQQGVKICSFSSKIRTNTEKRSTTIEKELMAMTLAIDAFYPVISSSEKILWIFTDHTNLRYYEKFNLHRRCHFK
jgi:RNase H-like domain found in reverse transcriptase